MAERLPGGKVHPMPDDLQAELIADSDATALWQDITTLARNEFICWVESAERDQTRQPHHPHERRVARRRASALLLAGLRPPREDRSLERGRGAAPAVRAKGSGRVDLDKLDQRVVVPTSAHVTAFVTRNCLRAGSYVSEGQLR